MSPLTGSTLRKGAFIGEVGVETVEDLDDERAAAQATAEVFADGGQR